MNFCVVHRVVVSKRTLLVLFVAVVFYVFLIIEGEAWNVKAEVKAMNLRTGSGCFGVYRWNSSTQSELVTSSDHVHY